MRAAPEIEIVAIEPALPGHEGRGLLMINGYLSRQSNAASWARAFRSRGYRGAIHALAWETGGPLFRHVAETGFASATTTGSALGALRGLPLLGRSLMRVPHWGTLAIGGAVFGAVAGHAALRHWRERAEAADRVGEKLALRLAAGRPDWAADELRLAGFSLGARVVLACLEAASGDRDAVALSPGTTLLQAPRPPRFAVERVDLFGGAVAGSRPWERALAAVRGDVVNHFSRSDWVLRAACRLLHPEAPIGLDPAPEPGLRNVDLTREITLHWSYPDVLGRDPALPGSAGQVDTEPLRPSAAGP